MADSAFLLWAMAMVYYSVTIILSGIFGVFRDIDINLIYKLECEIDEIRTRHRVVGRNAERGGGAINGDRNTRGRVAIRSSVLGRVRSAVSN